MKNERTETDNLKKEKAEKAEKKAASRLATLSAIGTPKKTVKDKDEENELLTRIPQIQAQIVELGNKITDLEATAKRKAQGGGEPHS